MFQLHMWSGIGIGLYILVVSVTGSIAVYRNELYASGPTGVRFASALLRLHDDLLAGATGRRINGTGAFLLIMIALTGLVVWWPGLKSWRRSVIVHRNLGWRRLVWELHSTIGFWTLGIVVLFALSGAYLAYPELFQDIADRLQPPAADYTGDRFVDRVIYWLAYLHFGRINGIGIPCRGPGICDQAVKFIWAVAGLVPAFMFITGVIMWWNRVLRKRLRTGRMLSE